MSILSTVMDVAGSAATGGIFGGLLRLAPEVLKLFTAKADREHELAMRNLDWQIAKESGEQKLREIDTQGQNDQELARLEAWREAIKAQGQTTGFWLADALNSLVRSVVTYYFCLLYGLAKIATAIAALHNGVAGTDAILLIWTLDDAAAFFGILGFWFVSRTLEPRVRQ